MSSVEDQPQDDGETVLPGVAGAVQAAVSSKAGTALTLPAATAFGAFFGEWAENTTARWREKRAANVKSHKSRVEQELGRSIPNDDLTEDQARAAAEWLEGAQKVDPKDDPEAAAMWQGLLDGVYSKNSNTQRMISAVQDLDSQQIRLLLSIGKFWSIVERDADPDIKVLVDRGLIVKADFLLFFYPVVAGVLASIVSFYAYSVIRSTIDFDYSRGASSLLIPVGMILATTMPFVIYILLRSYRLSKLGLSVKRKALKYLPRGIGVH